MAYANSGNWTPWPTAVRQPPFAPNLKKRLVKTPKVYVRDRGILHALLRIKDDDDLLGHPTYGGSRESYVIEQLLGRIGADWDAFFITLAPEPSVI